LDLEAIRPDLQEVRERHAIGLDELRPEAVERRRRSGQRTVRENIADLCDAESFIEYGALTLAGQRRRRPLEELIALSPADGLVAGIGKVNGAMFPDEQARCMVLAYDYTVFAATQDATIGMGGPAMIEGGGLGVFAPEEVGPVSMQAPNGVIDVLVADEAEAVRAAKRYLAYFQGSTANWSCTDQRLLRQLLPEN